jgi:hypothetical protein
VGGHILAGVLGVLVRYCISSIGSLTSLTRQIRHSLGGEERGTSYCVPHTSQMARSPDSKFMVFVFELDVSVAIVVVELDG